MSDDRSIRMGDDPVSDPEEELSPADFLRNVGNYLWRTSPAQTGMDQYHIERLFEIARIIEEMGL